MLIYSICSILFLYLYEKRSRAIILQTIILLSQGDGLIGFSFSLSVFSVFFKYLIFNF